MLTRLIGHRIVDALLVLLVVEIFAALLFGLYWLSASFITSGAGLIIVLATICLMSPLGIICILGYTARTSLSEKIEPVTEFLTRPIRWLSDKRRDSYMKLFNESNLNVGPRPPAEEYYDSRAKIEFDNNALYNNSEV